MAATSKQVGASEQSAGAAPAETPLEAASQAARLVAGRKRAQMGLRAPQKKFFRQRAHANPLDHSEKFPFPARPEDFCWERLYPVVKENAALEVQVLDIGCGYGGLLFGLAPILPTSLCLGLEIRDKVADFARLKILSQRTDGVEPAQRLAMLRTNSMRLLPRFFRKGQLTKIFICFPDPHFKRANHRRRIVSTALLSEYAYLLRPGARLYTISDVEELHRWMAHHGDEHPQFRRLTAAEVEADPCTEVMRTATEEGKKARREGRNQYIAAYERLPDAPHSLFDAGAGAAAAAAAGEAAAGEEAARVAGGGRRFWGGWYGGVAQPLDRVAELAPASAAADTIKAGDYVQPGSYNLMDVGDPEAAAKAVEAEKEQVRRRALAAKQPAK